MNRFNVLTIGLLAAIGAGLVFAGQAEARGPGWGDGPGWGEGRGGKMGKGGRGDCYRQAQPLEKELTVDDVKGFFEKRMERKGNPNVKLGSVVQKEDKTILVEIVTKDGSLVQQIEVDPATGRRSPVR